MWPYWLLFILLMFIALICEQHTNNKKNSSFYWKSIYFLLVVFIGFRFEVGGDWAAYLDVLDSYIVKNNREFGFQDPSFVILNNIAAISGMGIYFVNFISAAIFTFGLIVFCRSQPRPWLALLVSAPYLIIVVGMGYTRQATAIGVAMIGMQTLGKNKIVPYIFWIFIASTFHKSAVILIPLVILINSKNRIFTFIWVLISAVLFYILFVQEALSFLIIGYIDAEYQSSGAAIRVSMNAVPALIFMIYQNKFSLSLHEKRFWNVMSVTGLMWIIILNISPSSTAVDRIALYWIPLQVFVFSRLPGAISTNKKTIRICLYFIIFYSALVQFVWLFFADTAFAWIPYKFYPLVWLWN